MTSKNSVTIDTHAGRITLINVYEVDPGKQAELADLLADATEKVMRRHAGFVSVSIHSSLDGLRIVNYAQWASQEDLDRMLKNPIAQRQLKQFAALAKSVSPALYRVDSVHIG
jgi:quinol monooxygenase YgiN